CEKRRVLAEADPQLVRVRHAIFGRRIATVFVDRMKLRARREPLAVSEVELNIGDAQLRVTAAINRLFESDSLADRQCDRRERRPQRKLLFVAVAVVPAQLELHAVREVLCEEKSG